MPRVTASFFPLLLGDVCIEVCIFSFTCFLCFPPSPHPPLFLFVSELSLCWFLPTKARASGRKG